jgi:hypothetical protein
MSLPPHCHRSGKSLLSLDLWFIVCYLNRVPSLFASLTHLLAWQQTLGNSLDQSTYRFAGQVLPFHPSSWIPNWLFAIALPASCLSRGPVAHGAFLRRERSASLPSDIVWPTYRLLEEPRTVSIIYESEIGALMSFGDTVWSSFATTSGTSRSAGRRAFLKRSVIGMPHVSPS